MYGSCGTSNCSITPPHSHLADGSATIFSVIRGGKQDFAGTIDGAGYKTSMDDPIGKPELTQVPPPFIAGVARVLQYGARKYSRGNWLRGMPWNSVLDAMKRHIAAIEMGEDLDPESGLPHIDHIGCSVAFLSWYQNGPTKDQYKQFDDRMYKNG